MITKLETILSIFAFIVIPELSFSYPIFGTKRYHRANPVIPGSYQPQYYDQRPQYYQEGPSPYDGVPRYVEDPNVNYYPYPKPQYSLYGMPTYHGEYKPTTYYYAPGPSYTYSDDRVEPANPLDDIHEEIMQEDKLERSRDMLQPFGQETVYEKSSRPMSVANTNAAFLRNLIEYNNQFNQAASHDEPEYSTDYGDYDQGDPGYEQQQQQPGFNFENHHYDNERYQHNPPQVSKYTNEREDEDVQELKQLSHKNHHSNDNNNNNPDYWQQDSPSYDMDPAEYDDSQWINWDKRSNKPAPVEPKGQVVSSIFSFSNRKPTPIVKPTAKPETLTSSSKTSGSSGQKEVAQPVRHPFTAPKAETDEKPQVVAASANTIPTGSIYDTIKKILDMEHNLERNPEIKSSKIQKRFVTNEESLVEELDGLKRLAH